jgi:hypothetical protein
MPVQGEDEPRRYADDRAGTDRQIPVLVRVPIAA